MTFSRTLLLLIVASLLLSTLDARAATPGLVKEKPADGRFVETDQGFMVPYKQTIPGTDVTFEMTPVPGGKVTLGLREAEGDEETKLFSPKVTVELPPYWVGVREVNWSEYWPFMKLNTTFTEIDFLRGQLFEGNPALEKELEKRPELKLAIDTQASHVDGITAPTALYDPSTTYYSGDDPELPAVTMTVYAARQYTKWLSVLSDIDYRLPSEAEWEHAARAGAEGDLLADEETLGDYAWFDDNSDGDTHLVGEKRPNAWGLYDVIGNAAEWVLDAPTEEAASADKPLSWREAIATPKKQFPRIAKGGYWEAASEDCRFASRLLSNEEDWLASDPCIPFSPWWFSDDPASGVGVRLVRPLQPMDDQTKKFVWEMDSDNLASDVDMRLREGRGKLQSINKNLPKVVEQINSPEVRKHME